MLCFGPALRGWRSRFCNYILYICIGSRKCAYVENNDSLAPPTKRGSNHGSLIWVPVPGMVHPFLEKSEASHIHHKLKRDYKNLTLFLIVILLQVASSQFL